MFNSKTCYYCDKPVDPEGEPWRWVGVPDIGFKVHVRCEDEARRGIRSLAPPTRQAD